MSLIEDQARPGRPPVEGQQQPSRRSLFKLPGWLDRVDRGLLALLVVFVLTLPVFTPRIYASDEIKYFSYLHSIFFDRDVNFTNEYTYFYNTNPAKYADFKLTVLEKLNEKGQPINDGPVGSALLWTPFYGAAHVVALAGQAAGLKSFKPDGFSTPYIWSVTLASLLYGFAGLVLAYRLARNFVPAFFAAFATITIWLASPVIYYLSLTPPMSHANSLFMISLWLYLWYRTRGWRVEADGRFVPGSRRGSMWLLLGVLGGLMTMVREQDGAVMIVAALEALYLYYRYWRDSNGARDFLGRAGGLLGRNLIFLAGLVISLLPLLIVYQALHGRPGPGKTVGDKLQFTNPEVALRMLGLLFHPDHGLFWWSPVLLAAVAGLLLFTRARPNRLTGLLLLAAFVMELYISASFQTWTMKGSFSPRRLVGISPVYILGLAYLAWWLAGLKAGRRLSRRALTGLAALLVVWNFGLIIQYTTLRDQEGRQRLDPARVVRDQFTVVPGKLVDTAQKFLFQREKFYKS